MPLDQIANFVRGSAAASVGSADTTISVTDASTFPDPTSGRGEYNVVIWDVNNHPRPDQDADAEVIRVTGRDTTNDDLTVTRGQEGTTGASHPSGSAIHLAYTQKFADDIVAGFIEDSADTVMTTNISASDFAAGSVKRQRLPIAALEDTESVGISVIVPNNSTLTVYQWGAWKVADGTAPTGLDVELVDGSDTVQNSANTTGNTNTAGIVSYTNGSGSASVFKLRAKNGTGSDLTSPGVGGKIGWEVA